MKKTLTSDMEMQNLEIAQMAFALLLVQNFLTMAFSNGEVYPVNLELYDVLYVSENKGDYN